MHIYYGKKLNNEIQQGISEHQSIDLHVHTWNELYPALGQCDDEAATDFQYRN